MKVTIEFSSLEELADFMRQRGMNVDGIGKTRIEHMDPPLNVRAENVLRAEGIEFIEDAQARSEIELRRIPSMGAKSAKEIKAWKKAAS